MNEKVAINTVRKDTSNLFPVNSNPISTTSASTERKSAMTNKAYSTFNEKFETDSKHNSSCLTASGCFMRHNVARRDEFQTPQENYRSEGRYFSREDAFERRLISKVAILKKLGCVLMADETVEQFVLRNSDMLDES